VSYRYGRGVSLFNGRDFGRCSVALAGTTLGSGERVQPGVVFPTK
jgi:hypothetical protein